MVFRYWPRDPKGKNITPANTLPGKTAPNGLQLWGATIFDFYRVNRMPDVTSLSTITTGSKLMKWMKANGEIDYAKDEIAWAEMEEDPKVIEPWSPDAQIQEMEENVRQGKAGTSMPKDTKGKKVSTECLFDPANYPSPWPLVPFSHETERLTSIIDLNHLPKKLVVHDPWNLLVVQSENVFGRAKPYNGEEWTSMEDVTHIYRLQLSTHGVKRAKAEAEERSKAQKIEEAHLYLSPKHAIGVGNHSVVYQAEWELPRAAVVPPSSADYILCEQCVDADIARIIREEDVNPTCPHLRPLPEIPPTVRMRVIGKLSLKHDEHLVREAANYESFEKHMFQHWSGFNVLPPMHDPIPVGALVPQFYGYYVPESEFDDEDEDEENTEGNDEDLGYLSPILLLEDCGSPVDPKELTYDQKNEALSLIYRFHCAGWAHGSIYPRNIVIQPGPISAPPSLRSNEDPSFRLIDFGRSYQCKDEHGHVRPDWRGDRCHEESSVEKLFGMGLYSD
ncbi:hypothetical protein J132_11104 [Termitomyces sp. J132]|nr:hypothetical protein J132_11104 [Termitomyces sp. J132]